MNTIANQRISALRELMASRNINATIIPQTDPHQSEYLGAHWQVRRWFSGFTGSAGTLVVTRDKALLWVDSRYFIQATAQVDGSEIGIMKIAMPGTPTINEYLTTNLRGGDTVGLDGMLFSSSEIDKMKREFKPHGIKIATDFDPADGLWNDRPALPDAPVIIHDTKYAGESAESKLVSLRKFIADNKADAMLISALDELAWALNIRSRDVRCNPVATAYLLVGSNDATLFINPDKITDEVATYLSSLGIAIAPYDSLSTSLAKSAYPVVAIDPATTSARVIEILNERAKQVTSPITLNKAVKNEIQIQGIRQAMVRDGVALVKGFMEIERRVKAGERITEITVSEILKHHRSERDLFFDESFDTIAGYGSHGAIVHYSATPETDVPVGTSSLLLVDSGAQYLDGTTDITRTIIIGEPSEAQRRHFTLVLKGNIDLVSAIFPQGTRGTQLDALAHLPLWKAGLNYMHGTGHGVGHFLNVHEGPHSIRTNEMPTPLEPGMIVTDEPGLYLEGEYGIRCENTLLVVPAMHTDMGQFYGFESLTLFPFDRKLVDTAILDYNELNWLNNYHHRVYTILAPHLDETEREWLRQQTAPIN
ncbi:MAG: aminopeptidase P family protein [Bacteroides sp.]|nr:aminopeptidase P family protein [Bacteroides sp.]